MEGTALVTCHYGGFNELRRRATLRALEDWEAQCRHPESAVFIELVCPGQEPCFSDRDMPSWLKYLRMRGRKRNDGLFQKEALWNIGARFVDGSRLLFIDSDCSPLGTCDYFGSVFDACVDGTVVHVAYRLVNEKLSPDGTDMIYYSAGIPEDRLPAGARTYPGLGYAITRHDYDLIDGFNTYSVTGAGDAVFISEIAGEYVCRGTLCCRYFNAIMRRLPVKLRLTAVPGTEARHNFHGTIAGRAYMYSRIIVDMFGDPRSYCHVDQSGLMAWNDPECMQARLFMKKSRMSSREDTLKLLCDTMASELGRIEKAVNTNTRLAYDKTDDRRFT